MMSQKETIKRFFHYLWPHRRAFVWSVMLMLAASLVVTSKAWVIKPFLDAMMDQSFDYRDLLLLCGIVGLVFLSQGVLAWLYQVQAKVASGAVIRDIRRDLSNKLALQGLEYFASRSSADILSRIINDIVVFEGSAVIAGQHIIRYSIQIILLLAYVFWINAQVAILCVVVACLTGFLLVLTTRPIQRISRDLQGHTSKITVQLSEMIGGIDVVLSFGLAQRMKKEFDVVTSKLYQTQLKSTKYAHSIASSIVCITGLGISGIIYITGSAILTGQISVSEFASLLVAIYLLQQPALVIVGVYPSLAVGLAALGRGLELLGHDSRVKEPKNPKALSTDRPDISFNKISFSYDGQKKILDELSLTIKSGSFNVVVGDSGAGKSTLLKLIMRFYDPECGSVELGGISLRDIAKPDLYSRVSYVPQDVFLFDGSLHV